MKTIVLIGMPASGKTTTAKFLSDYLNLKYVDIDSEIEKVAKITITEIFSTYGENYFREIEKSIIEKIFEPQDMIISLGGGAFENSQTREFLLNNSIVIYLETSPQTIFERTKNNSQRPLLQNNSISHIEEIFSQRQKHYKLAQFSVLTDNKTTKQIVKEICKCVNLK